MMEMVTQNYGHCFYLAILQKLGVRDIPFGDVVFIHVLVPLLLKGVSGLNLIQGSDRTTVRVGDSNLQFTYSCSPVVFTIDLLYNLTIHSFFLLPSFERMIPRRQRSVNPLLAPVRFPSQVDHLHAGHSTPAAGSRITIILNGGDQIPEHQALEKQPASIFMWLPSFVVILFFYTHLFPSLLREVMLTVVNKHCGTDTFSQGDVALGADEVNAVASVISRCLSPEIGLGVDAAFEAEGGEAAFAHH